MMQALHAPTANPGLAVHVRCMYLLCRKTLIRLWHAQFGHMHTLLNAAVAFGICHVPIWGGGGAPYMQPLVRVDG